MHSKMTISNITIPTYGTMILLGAVIVTILGIMVCKLRGLQVTKFLTLELIGGMSAIIGAKLWSMRMHAEQGISLPAFWRSGYSSYGGILLGMVAVYGSAKLLHLDFARYAKKLIFLVPLFHAFWKVGCYFGGCCYGIAYSGPGAVVFPSCVLAPAGVPLFPVQLLEAAILGILSVACFVKSFTVFTHPVLDYIGWYASLRFLTEFLRQHANPTGLSVAQIVSVTCDIRNHNISYVTQQAQEM